MSQDRLPDLEDLRTHAAPGTLLERALRGDHRRRRRNQRLAVVGGAVALLVLGAVLSRPPQHPPTTADVVAQLQVPYTLDLDAPGASRVEVVGSWSGWEPEPMEARGAHFTVSLMLEPGRYEYMFLVDGKEWRPDPRAPLSHDDGFGHVNSVLNI